MELIKKYKSQLVFHLVLNVIIGVFITFSSYYHIPLDKPMDYLFYIVHFIVLQFTVFGFVYLLSLNKYLFKILFPLLFIIYSGIAYWVYLLDVSVNDSMIQVLLETKTDIVFDLISLPLLGFLLIIILVLFFLFRLYNRITINQLKSPLMLLAIIAIACFLVIENYKYGTLKRRLPYSPIFSFVEYFKKPKIELIPVDNCISKNDKDLNIVFVLGEAVRADHLQINGYPRKTTPNLSKMERVLSFNNVYTPHTFTALSVPQLLTSESVDDTNSKAVYSIYSILNKLDIETIWLGNQTPERSYRMFMEENNKFQLIDQFHNVLSYNKKLDEELLPPFKETFNNITNQFITVHMIGSHWWYENKYSDDFRVFKPVIKSKYIPSVTQQEMINSYDNTLLYLDDFLAKLIVSIENIDTNTLLIYISDHGETLGEDGKWLHGHGHAASQNPAVIFWYSKGFEKNYPNKVINLKKNLNERISLDFFYHSILDIYSINCVEYDESKSVFK